MAHLLEVSTTQLGAAKHRFESWQRPMVQFILTLPAFVQVAQKIAIMRHGKEEARDATSFLEGLTEEKVLLLAMLADAADECLVVTRVFDQEDAEISSQASVLRHFQDRLHALFTKGQVLHLESSQPLPARTCRCLSPSG